ncbi:MAG: hypothetical protein V1644_01160, partial [Candidatus Micrarchaeota archaeon]
MEWIDEILENYSNAISTSDPSSWSGFNYFNTWPYYAEHRLNRLWKMYEKCQEKKLTPSDLTKCFLGPLFLRQEIVNTMFFSKCCDYDKEKTMKLITWFKDILVAKCSEDPYGKNSTKILTHDDVAYLIKMFPFHHVEENEAREAGKLIHACEALSWSYFFDWNYWQCFEVYGPYKLPHNHTLMLRAFTDFAPSDVWPTAVNFEPSTVYVYTVYKDCDVKLDFWSHVNTNDNLPQKMTKLLVMEHGRILNNIEQLTELRKKVEVVAVMQGKRFKEMTFEETKIKEIETHCYTYRDLCKLLEMEW